MQTKLPPITLIGWRRWADKGEGMSRAHELEAALTIAESLIADGWRIYIDGPRFEDRVWRVMFARDRVTEWAQASDLAVAIRLAAAKATGGEP